MYGLCMWDTHVGYLYVHIGCVHELCVRWLYIGLCVYYM